MASDPIVFFQVSKCNMKTVQKIKFSINLFLLSNLSIAIYRLTNLNYEHWSLRIKFLSDIAARCKQWINHATDLLFQHNDQSCECVELTRRSE